MFYLVVSVLLCHLLPVLAFNKTSKRGLTFPAVNNPADLLNINQSHSQISWVYDWGLSIPPYIATSNLEYVPMQWGAGNIENLSSTLQQQQSKIVLGFNEPDQAAQSNIDPTLAAQLWRQYMNPLKQLGIRIGGPAISSSGQPWLTQFMAACTGCEIDFLNIHWYGEGTAGFYDYLWSLRGQYPNMTFWVTEYADTTLNDTEVVTFSNQTTVYLDGLDWVERYAWFGYFRPQNGSDYNMLDADGGLNDLGEAYIGAGTVEKSGPVASTAAMVGSGGPTYSTLTISTASFTPTFVSGSPRSYLPSNQLMWCTVITLASCVFGFTWTIL